MLQAYYYAHILEFMKDFPKIEPPMFRVGGSELNEYELRALQVQVALGEQPVQTRCLCLTTNVGFSIAGDGSIVLDNERSPEIATGKITTFLLELMRQKHRHLYADKQS